MTTRPLLSVSRLAKHYPVKHADTPLRAVDGVSFDVRRGEILGIVGESGCGKSTLGKTLIGIQHATEGGIAFEDRELTGLDARGWRAVRARLQYVYQDPGASLDPRWTIARSLDEPLAIHAGLGRAARRERVLESVRAVGLTERHLDLYPHELSGGQQRRVGLARILTLRPALVILDEPTSGLDVSVQATILKLMRALREQFDLTYIFISHDLSVVRLMCDRVAVMYLGRIVEIGATEQVFAAPAHPYTRSLLAAVPEPGARRVVHEAWLDGDPPDPTRLPQGCRFRTRCPLAFDRCAAEEPGLDPVAPGHAAACHLAATAMGAAA